MKIVALAVLAAALAAPAAFAAPKKKAPRLIGTDGPGFTITLTQGGKKVKALKAGAYTILIRDKSNIHNFHLTGPGLNKKTGVDFKGNSTWKVKLKKGVYRYVCDPHKTIMKGSFRVR